MIVMIATTVTAVTVMIATIVTTATIAEDVAITVSHTASAEQSLPMEIS